MKVTIVGTGRMGRAIASRAVAGGHEVEFIGTHISKAQALADEMIGEGSVQAADLVHGDLVVLAVPYTEAPHMRPPVLRSVEGDRHRRPDEPGRLQHRGAARR